MKGLRISIVLLLAALIPAAPPASAAKRELVQILQQVNNLQVQMQILQQTIDRQAAVMQTLIEQTTEGVRAMQTEMSELRLMTQQNLASSAARIETIATQIEILNASLEEAKARIGRIHDGMVETHNILQTINTTSETDQSRLEGAAGVPSATTLYETAYRDFASGQYQLAIQEFQEYLHYHQNTDLASNAQYYIGDCYYNQGNFRQAVEEYNRAIERYPTGNKLASAQLKKAFALLELKQRQAGVRELRSLISRFPRASESDLARARLEQLGITLTGGL